MKLVFCSMALVLGLYGTVQAQERAAGNALETQMTWSALKNLVDDANATSKAVDTRLTVVNDNLGKVKGRVDLIENCNLKGKIYSPGNGADTEGCITPGATVQTEYLHRYVDESITCVQKDGTFTPTPSAGGAAPAGWKPGTPTGTCVVNTPDIKNYGDVGSYVLAMRVDKDKDLAPGSIVDGSRLRPAALQPSMYDNNSTVVRTLDTPLPGKWRAMGWAAGQRDAGDGSYSTTTLYMRVK